MSSFIFIRSFISHFQFFHLSFSISIHYHSLSLISSLSVFILFSFSFVQHFRNIDQYHSILHYQYFLIVCVQYSRTIINYYSFLYYSFFHYRLPSISLLPFDLKNLFLLISAMFFSLSLLSLWALLLISCTLLCLFRCIYFFMYRFILPVRHIFLPTRLHSSLPGFLLASMHHGPSPKLTLLHVYFSNLLHASSFFYTDPPFLNSSLPPRFLFLY